MKRIVGLILTAVFLSALCIPCAAAVSESATMKRRSYPGFSDIPSTESPYFGAVKACYEWGLMNGTSETTFEPQGNLSIAQLVALTARLYSLVNGGSGTIPPELPDLSEPYVRFYDESGGVIAAYPLGELPYSYTGGMNPYFCLSLEEDDASLPETCRMEIGFEGYNNLRSYNGLRQTYHSEPGTMTQGFQGTGYCFEDFDDLDGTSVFWYHRNDFSKLTTAWWYPSLFYLSSEGRVDYVTDLLFPAAGEEEAENYDALTRFSIDHATRSLFARLVDLTAGELETLNETVNIPDVKPEETFGAAGILRLYQAGILTGVDKAGNFGGDQKLTRAQAAIMMARVLDPSSRVKTG